MSSLKRAWIADLSPTLRAVIEPERGTIVLTRHGTDVFTLNASEARKLVEAYDTTRPGLRAV